MVASAVHLQFISRATWKLTRHQHEGVNLLPPGRGPSELCLGLSQAGDPACWSGRVHQMHFCMEKPGQRLWVLECSWPPVLPAFMP